MVGVKAEGGGDYLTLILNGNRISTSNRFDPLIREENGGTDRYITEHPSD